jgi:hypothetical protein
MRENSKAVPPRPPGPSASTTRPPEPFRPAPARRAGTSLLAARARRRRFGAYRPRADESGW